MICVNSLAVKAGCLEDFDRLGVLDVINVEQRENRAAFGELDGEMTALWVRNGLEEGRGDGRV